MTKLAVVLPTYKGDNLELLKLAVDSILNQSFRDFWLILVLDGPLNSNQEDFLKTIHDKRVEVIRLEKNAGLPTALNKGVKRALDLKVEFVARMDADDISYLYRFEKQISYLKDYTDVDILGSEADLIDNDSKLIGYKKVMPNVDFRSLLENCELIHPSVMFRATVFSKIGFYDEMLQKSQDYELWLRAANQNIKIRNIKKPLLQFRYEDKIIDRRKKEQKFNILIKKKYVSGLSFYRYSLRHFIIMYLPENILKILLLFKIR